MRPLPSRIVLAVALLMVVLVLPAKPALAFFSDVGTGHWAYDAIDYVAWDNTWMQDYGTGEFKPDELETRSFLARALVTVFAPDEPIDPTITFSDLPEDDEFYPYANVAVKLGWMAQGSGDSWNGELPIKGSKFDKAIVLAIGGLDLAIGGLESIHQGDGDVYDVEPRFAYVQLARWLDLRYDHDDEDADLQKDTKMPRDEVAYGLWMAATLPSYRITDASVFNDVALPSLNDSTKLGLTQFSLDQVGFPYIWAGEWNKKSPVGYCCGDQPQGGFDCSGFTWWVLKKNEGGYNAAQYRTYSGYTLPERTSSLMAEAAPNRIAYEDLKVGNLLFFASNGGNGWDDVDHVGIYLGWDWMIHSTGGGPQLQWVAEGWYFDNFVWGRQLVTKGLGPMPPGGLGANRVMGGTVGDPTAGEPAVAP
jgi:cell wall-associated NlpC family hydrolase